MSDEPNPFDRYLQKAPAAVAGAPAAADNPFARYVAPSSAAPAGSPTATTSDASPEEYELSSVPGEAARNFIPSLKKHGEELVDAASDPIGLAKMSVQTWLNPVTAARALGPAVIKNVMDRYGSWANVKKTAAEDPSGFLMDALTFVPGAGQVGKIGAAGKVLKAAELADPARALSTIRSIASKGGDAAAVAADHAAQTLEGIGSGAVKEMFESGKAVTPGVWKTLTGGLDLDKSYDMIKDSLGSLFGERHNNYDAMMSAIQGADKPVDFAKVDNAVNDAAKIGTYKAVGDKSPGPGYQFERDPSVMKARARIIAEVQRYRMLPPEYHTAFGFDKLKQAITTIGNGLEDGGMPTRGSKFANDVAGSVRKTILDEVPEYGKAMEKYGADSDQIKGLIKEFSLKDGNKLATLRKLQKVWRQSADVAHGERTNMLRDAVEKTGNQDLMSHLAAGQFNPVVPRGLRGAFLGADLPLAAGHAMISPATGIPHLAAAGAGALLSSPRLLGTSAYGLGRVAGSTAGRAVGTGTNAAVDSSPWLARAQRWSAPPEERKRGGFFRGAR